jgi:predicted RNA-binding protein associated with RNAse of E/G family
MEPITVLKRNLQSEVTWEYPGLILERGENFVRLEARFNRPDMPFMDVVLKHNDRFVETFYTDRWYNIFEIHDRDDDQVKGWYCNLGRPAMWDEPDKISYVDLGLDLWVAMNGKQTVLDEHEFEALELDEVTREKVLAALADLQILFLESKQDGN